MADFTNRNADETKQFILTFDENGGSPEYTKIEDANGVDRTAEVVELLGINDKEDADSTILKEGDVEDSLNSTSTTKPLSANQGKQLNDDKASLSAINNDPDFYEEGTWTPTDATSAGLTLDINTSRTGYIKKGNECTVWADITIPDNSDGIGVSIGGLPFPVAIGQDFTTGGFFTRCDNGPKIIRAQRPDNINLREFSSGIPSTSYSSLSEQTIRFVVIYKIT